MKSLRLWSFTFLAASLAGCASYVTKEEFAPKMYSEHPVSILVLPPINKSTAADAKEYYATTVAEPLTNSGYYVFPMEVVYDILQQEGLFDTETMLYVPTQRFREFFGADAVLYVTILEWDTQYLIIDGSVTVKAACELRSTHTGDVLWFYDEGRLVICTHGFWKGVRTAPAEIRRAKQIRERYLQDKLRGLLQIDDE